jgi:hypothetical protein
VFDRVLGLPAHPLFIHAAVVLVPLLAVVAVLYAVWPASRRHVRWPMVAFALAAPGAVYFAKESGESFRTNSSFQPAEAQASITKHEDFANVLFWLVLGLALVTLVMAFMIPSAAGGAAQIKAPVVAHWVVAALSVVLAATSLYYVYRTGDSGAKMVWSGF